MDFTTEPLRVNFYVGLKPVNGYLTFEDWHFTFHPGSASNNENCRKWNYADIASVRATNIMFISPTGTLVKMNDGTVVKFAMPKREEFQDFLRACAEEAHALHGQTEPSDGIA